MKEKIKEIIKQAFELQKVDDLISQSNCNQWDSLRHLNLIVDLEEAFKVSFEPEEIAEMKDLKYIEAIILKKKEHS